MRNSIAISILCRSVMDISGQPCSAMKPELHHGRTASIAVLHSGSTAFTTTFHMCACTHISRQPESLTRSLPGLGMRVASCIVHDSGKEKVAISSTTSCAKSLARSSSPRLMRTAENSSSAVASFSLTVRASSTILSGVSSLRSLSCIRLSTHRSSSSSNRIG